MSSKRRQFQTASNHLGLVSPAALAARCALDKGDRAAQQAFNTIKCKLDGITSTHDNGEAGDEIVQGILSLIQAVTGQAAPSVETSSPLRDEDDPLSGQDAPPSKAEIFSAQQKKSCLRIHRLEWTLLPLTL